MDRVDSAPVRQYTHMWVLVRMAFATAIVFGFSEFAAWVSPADLALKLSDHWAVFCYSFVVAWWMVYFNSARSGVLTLRTYLRQYSTALQNLDGTSPDVDYAELTEAMNVKCASSIEVQGIYIAVMSLLLVFVTQIQEPTIFQQVLIRIAISSALVSILLLVITSDMLDTSSNRFLIDVGPESWAIKRRFYRGINPPGISNGYAYYGFSIFTFFIIVAISLEWPPLGGIGVAILTYFGYPYWFGYKRVVLTTGTVVIEHDSRAWPSVLLGSFFILGTIGLTALPLLQ